MAGLCFSTGLNERNTSYVYPPWKHTWGVRRATPFKLRLFLGNKTHFDDPQGIACVRLESWDDSTTTDDDDELVVYGVNSGENCIIFNRSMYSLGVYGLGPDEEKFDRPWGIAADARGNVYVADRGNARVVHLFNPDRGLFYIDDIGAPGSEPGKFVDPRGVALDTDGRIYVTDAGLGRVTVFDELGGVVDTWGGFDGPDAVAVVGPDEEWSFYRGEGFAVVIDSLHRRVRKLSLTGEPLGDTTPAEWGVKNSYLAYATIDYHNNIIITDKRNGCLHKLNHNLNHLTSFGEPGTGDYQFDEPRGVTIYRRFGQLFVAERKGAQYLWVGVDVKDFAARVVRRSRWRDLEVDFYLTEPAFCSLDVIDNFGRFITRITTRRRFDSGCGHIAWNMRIPQATHTGQVQPELPQEYQRGEQLPPGRYVIKARFRAIYSSREHFVRDVKTDFVVD